MRRAAGLSPDAGKRSSRRMHSGPPHHPKAAGSRGPSPPAPPESRSCSLTPPFLRAPKPPPARARHVVFEDEVTPVGRPSGRVPRAEEGEKPGARPVPPGLAPRPRAIPDYVVKYPAIRSPGQREGYKGVFQDQLAEYTELLGEVRAARRGRGGPEGPGGPDWAFLEKQQRCEYLKKKLTHIKARIQDYDRDARDSTGRF
ncbi:unnamed protein product [Bubo scandiacus]